MSSLSRDKDDEIYTRCIWCLVMKNNLQGSAADDDDEEDEPKDDDEVEIIFLTAIIRLKAAARVQLPRSSPLTSSQALPMMMMIFRSQSRLIRLSVVARSIVSDLLTYTFIEKPHGAVDLIRGFIIALLRGIFHLGSIYLSYFGSALH